MHCWCTTLRECTNSQCLSMLTFACNVHVFVQGVCSKFIVLASSNRSRATVKHLKCSLSTAGWLYLGNDTSSKRIISAVYTFFTRFFRKMVSGIKKCVKVKQHLPTTSIIFLSHKVVTSNKEYHHLDVGEMVVMSHCCTSVTATD